MIILNKTLIYYVATFLAGFSLMVVEIVSSRIVAPIIGASIFTWTSVIGVTLLGLSIGSLVGGAIADRFLARYGQKVLAFAFLLSSLSVAMIIPLSKNLNVILDQTFSIMVMSVVVCVVLFFVPTVSIGTLAPIIFKSYVANIEDIGKKYGILSSLWSLGSIFGVFISGFYLISTIGSSSTVLLVSVVLLVMFYIFYLLSLDTQSSNYRDDVRFIAAVTLVLALFLTLTYGSRQKTSAQVIFEKETAYYTVKVVDYNLHPEYGKNRILFLDIDPHSIQTEDASQRFYTDIYPVFSALSDTISSIHVIGAGAYTLPIKLKIQYPLANVSVSEIDPDIELVGRAYFGLSEYDIETETIDARRKFASDQGSGGSMYDLIYGDAYNSFVSVPWHLLTKEHFIDIKEHINPGGIYAVNFTGAIDGPQSRLFDSVYTTFTAVFPNNYVFAFGRTRERIQNITIVGLLSDDTFTDDFFVKKLDAVDPTKFLSGRYVPRKDFASGSLSSGILLTDDFAPIEAMMVGLIKDYFPRYLELYNEVLG